MTWFIRPKSAQPLTSPPCARCHQRPGVIHLTHDIVSTESREQSVWICAECARDLRNDAASS